uniref:Uncharacterized protein n=1 Tax=Anguilla anguilla TaxID=7936 RepID=A0A0E9RVC7_ANGAN
MCICIHIHTYSIHRIIYPFYKRYIFKFTLLSMIINYYI